MDRMDISLLLLKLKTGDPGLLEKFTEKLAGLVDKND